MALSKTIGSIAVDLVARTKKWDQGVNKARGRLQEFATFASKVGGILTGIFVSNQIVQGINRMTAELDKLAKTARRLGLAVEDLQALRFAGELSGVGGSTLEMALQRQQRRIAEAAQGTGEAVKALAELGLNASRLNELDPASQLLEIAEAMKEVALAGDQTRLSMKLWDSEGVPVVTMLDDLRANMEEFKRKGLALSSEDLANIEAWNDFWTRMGYAFEASGGKALAATIGAGRDESNQNLYGLLLGAAAGTTAMDTKRVLQGRRRNQLARERQERRAVGADIEARALERQKELVAGAEFMNMLPTGLGQPMAMGGGRFGHFQFGPAPQQGSLFNALKGIAGNIVGQNLQSLKRMGGSAAIAGVKAIEKWKAGEFGSGAVPPGLNLMRSGSAAAHRQQAMIRRDVEGRKLDKERNSFLKTIAEGFQERLIVAAADFGR